MNRLKYRPTTTTHRTAVDKNKQVKMERKSILQNIKWPHLYIAMCTLALSSLMFYSPSSYAVYTYILGNSTVPQKYGPGPTTDGTSKLNYSSRPTVYFTQTDNLAPANVKINWDDNHGSGDDGTHLYCTRSQHGTGQGLSIESSFVSAGHYGGVEIFKTNITGLYFSLHLRGMSAAGAASISPATLDVTSGISHNVLQLSDIAGHCDTTTITGDVSYANWGGWVFTQQLPFIPTKAIRRVPRQ